MVGLRTMTFVVACLALIVALASCTRTKQDITVERHVVGEEFVVE